MSISVGRDKTVSDLLDAYCGKTGMNRQTTTLQFDGDFLDEHKKISDCDLEDEDQLDAQTRVSAPDKKRKKLFSFL